MEITYACPYCGSHIHVAQGERMKFCICGATMTVDSRGNQDWTKPGRMSKTYSRETDSWKEKS